MNLVNLVSVVAIVLLGLLLLVFTVLLPLSVMFSTRSGMNYRRVLARKLEKLRLGKMLKALGIDTSSYLSTEYVVNIHKQMDRCTACKNTEECDTRLDEGDLSAETIDFCNNEESLQKIDKQLKN